MRSGRILNDFFYIFCWSSTKLNFYHLLWLKIKNAWSTITLNAPRRNFSLTVFGCRDREIPEDTLDFMESKIWNTWPGIESLKIYMKILMVLKNARKIIILCMHVCETMLRMEIFNFVQTQEYTIFKNWPFWPLCDRII